MFDLNQQVDIKIPTGEVTKTVKVRFPSDDEFEKRSLGRRLIIRQLGRGATETEITNEEAIDAQLFESIKIEGDDLDSAEAVLVVGQLLTAEVTDVEREGTAFRVSLRTAAGPTEHLLKIPTQRQVMDYRKKRMKMKSLPYGKTEVRVMIRAAEALYDALFQERTGYVEGSKTPLFHKSEAVEGAISALDREFANEMAEPDENFQ